MSATVIPLYWPNRGQYAARCDSCNWVDVNVTHELATQMAAAHNRTHTEVAAND